MLSRGAAAPRAVLLVRTVQTAVAIGPTGVHRAGGSLNPVLGASAAPVAL
jgi:hypothetical protein